MVSAQPVMPGAWSLPHDELLATQSQSEHQTESTKQADQQSDYEDSSDVGKSAERSVLESESQAGFSQLDGDVKGQGYNETLVDIVAIPCIGASPVDTWSREPFDATYFDSAPPNVVESQSQDVQHRLPDGVVAPDSRRPPTKTSPSWIRQGIRQEINTARIMLYRHRTVHAGFTLDDAADDLLQHLVRIRAGLNQSRPFFFICHSIGGLVAKLALVKASQIEDLRPLMYACHGITFFATPHRGSSYLSMPKLRESIQHLLFLQVPLPPSITGDLRLGYKPLIRIHDRFTDIASEMRVWTFCETVDSQLSGLGTSDHDEVHFSAPIASIKSSLSETRGEKVFSLESDHAHCASFGPGNVRIMHSYLQDLGAAVRKAQKLSASFDHTPLKLNDKVKVELIGFYEDPDDTKDQDIRLYIAKHNLAHFLEMGPERCLKERLETVAARPQRMSAAKQGYSSLRQGNSFGASSALQVFSGVQKFGQKVFGVSRGASDASIVPPDADSPATKAINDAEGVPIPEIVLEPLPPAIDYTITRSQSSRPASAPVPSEGLRQDVKLQQGSDSEGDLAAGTSRDFMKGMPALVPTDTASPSQARTTSSASSYSSRNASRTADAQEMTAGFSRPDPNKRKIMWIHLPFNNPHWVKLVFDKLAETHDRSYSWLLNNEHWAKRHVKDRHANQHASYVRSGCAFAPSQSHTPALHPVAGGIIDPRRLSDSLEKDAPSHLYVFLPYLNFDTYLNVIRRRNIVRRRMAQGRARPVPPDIAQLDSLEARVIWDYIGYDPPLNTRRTLDQYGYPELQDTYARDDDQMLYKLTKERFSLPFKKKDMYNTGAEKQILASLKTPLDSNPDLPAHFLRDSARTGSIAAMSPTSGESEDTAVADSEVEEDILDGNVLIVDQLWMWAINTSTVATFFPKRESHPSEGQMFQQADLRNSIYNELNGDLTGRCDNALELAAFIVLHAVTVLIDRTSHPDLEVFRIFEEALGILNERMTSSLKRFRMATFKGRIGEDPTSSESESDGYDDRPESIKKRHQREMAQAERENRENTSALLELRDMDDELLTLKNLFDEQAKVVETMSGNYERPELLDLTGNGRRYLEEAKERLDDYRRITKDLLFRIEATRNDYDKFQEMVQRKAQLDEVRWSRLQTELASSQNLSVMIFTTFTVIFLPLSFFTSLFGMNTAEWAPDEDYISLTTIGAISLPSSVLLILLSLILAFSTRVQGWFRSMFHLVTSTIKLAISVFARVEPKQRRRARQEVKKEAVRMRREQRRQRKRERGYDFWETVWENRRSRYDIPDSNLRNATERRLQGRGDTWNTLAS
ncbi:uncharacterized protein B0I36DRAFT_287943 [Microdochium trichocladiopsis]|uniref:DUF676 domain-containing protein n=1 Tax=Microdochium trichocladiopsis TaxID=1682393 RepID=A0A9P8YAE2_9PEZI|nr:uncharacterized protein B0I36DRAFT_287943 [Microdochium trichocladiopsis]KAH7033621.1 hypothetical protein B0I36DRAFT_287943 [Microdochium trichocladiopsis]